MASMKNNIKVIWAEYLEKHIAYYELIWVVIAFKQLSKKLFTLEKSKNTQHKQHSELKAILKELQRPRPSVHR